LLAQRDHYLCPRAKAKRRVSGETPASLAI
jgi:hypothetical protein